MKRYIYLIIAGLAVWMVTVAGKKVEKVNMKTDCKVVTIECKAEGNFPNSTLPVVVYKGVFPEPDASAVIKHMELNGWQDFWRNGVYDFHHYHSTAHEVLACYRGKAKVQFGGPKGKIADFEKGDVVFIPAGVAHKRIESSLFFAVLGGYPDGQRVDMKYGKAEELSGAKDDISKVKLPTNDPVFGGKGQLGQLWKFSAEKSK